MQNLIIDQPYKFVAPRYSAFWAGLVKIWLRRHVRVAHGITSWECRGVEHLQASLDAGHGVLLAPNHCRPCDPMLLSVHLAGLCGRAFHTMASWHLFKQNPLLAFLLPRVGAFSMYREGPDRESLKCAAGLLAAARHPLVLFPEGFITRGNDCLHDMMDGVAFLARLAAQQRAAQNPPGKVVVHPVFLRYFHEGDMEAATRPVLDMIDARLGWQIAPRLGMKERVKRIGLGLLALKEIEYFGNVQPGDTVARRVQLMEQVLAPLEHKFTGGRSDGSPMDRVKRLRGAILPGLIDKEIPPQEKARRWLMMGDLYFAQQLVCYPSNYLDGEVPPEHWLETVERFEEDLTDSARAHPPLHAVITVGTAIDCDASHDRRRESAHVTAQLKNQMDAMMIRSLACRRDTP